MQHRDEVDSGREVSPLYPADDAIIIDTSKMTIERVLEVVTALITEQVS
jgi:cytidylate kinase